jgi:class 3 adenylate cyclase
MVLQPNERTQGKTGEYVQHSGQYAAVGCCRTITSLQQGCLFPSCPAHGATTWGWIPSGAAIGLVDYGISSSGNSTTPPPITFSGLLGAAAPPGTVVNLGSGLFPSSTPISEIARTTPRIEIDLTRHDELQKAEREIIRLKKHLDEINKKLAEAQARGEAATEELKEAAEIRRNLEAEVTKAGKEKEIQHIKERIEPAAQGLLHDSPAVILDRLREGPCQAFVMSVDIRRSTSLMLKAREPKLFAKFITDLCERLRQAVWTYHGVFDKFTGDGILAFFPETYTGKDAGYFAIRTAAECHSIFKQEYVTHRQCFNSILADVGLGVGIDYGEAHLVSLWGGLTVVGEPVVYACRLGGAPVGQTFLNQRAFEVALANYATSCSFEETVHDTKSDGNLVAYRTILHHHLYQPEMPLWWGSLREDKKPTENPASR